MSILFTATIIQWIFGKESILPHSVLFASSLGGIYLFVIISDIDQHEEWIPHRNNHYSSGSLPSERTSR